MGFVINEKILPILVIVINLISCNMYTKDGQKCTKDHHGNEHCYKDDYDEDEMDIPMFYDEESNAGKQDERLFIWDPVRVGFEREIEVQPGQKVKMITKAVHPKVFVIDNFLNDKEADHIIAKAKQYGMWTSSLHIDSKIRSDYDLISGMAQGDLQYMSTWDHNNDRVIDLNDVLKTAQVEVKLYINESEALDMFKELKIKEMDDGVITQQEFQRLNTAGLYQYMQDLRNNHPRFRDRFSEQIWLRQNDKSDHIMYNLREKVMKLTNLPRYIIEGGEPLQVLNYQPHGHYHAHFDGQSGKTYPNKVCCHLDIESQPYECLLCRLVTIIYYLNDVPGGGETAFPVADLKGYVHEEFQQRNNGDLYNLSEFCYNASLVVKPKKGRAVMFYNHELDNEGWLGDMDEYSLHGGCDVTKGEKWMANNWIPAPPSKFSHMHSLYGMPNVPGVFHGH